MTCSTLGNLEIRTLKPNRFKNQSSNTLKLLGRNCNHQQGFIKQKTVAYHHCSFNLKFPKHCYCNRYYRWNSSYWKLEQYWIRWLWVHSSPIVKLLFHTKIGGLLRGIFLRKFPNSLWPEDSEFKIQDSKKKVRKYHFKKI